MEESKYPTFSLLSMRMVEKIQKKNGHLFICQGKIIGFMKPNHIKNVGFLVLEGEEKNQTHVAIPQHILKEMTIYLTDDASLQVIGKYDKELNIVRPIDMILLTPEKEVLFVSSLDTEDTEDTKSIEENTEE